MKQIKIDPNDYPLQEGESWWIVHPNYGKCQFKVPVGAICACLNKFLGIFHPMSIYTVTHVDDDKGWITVGTKGTLVEMPRYVFARYFDANQFIVGNMPTPEELEQATPFDYKRTVKPPTLQPVEECKG
jgi:hypothetical protein